MSSEIVDALLESRGLQSSGGRRIYAGVDDGYAETKVDLSTGVSIRIASQGKSGKMSQISINGSATTVYSYGTGEGDFVVGNIVDADTTAFDDYPMSAMNRVIVAHALRQAGVEANDQLCICTGLPIKKYYVSGQINKRLIKAKRDNLLKNDVVANDGRPLARIAKHDVISEGIAAWIDIVIQRDSQGNLVRNNGLIEQRIAIVDIGGRTTDIAVIQDWNLDFERSSTVNVGMLDVRDDLAGIIGNKYDFTPRVEQLNDAMFRKEIKLWGEMHDVSDVFHQSLKQVVHRIETEVKKCLGDASDLDQVVFVGGAVTEMGPYLQDWFRQQDIGHEPSFANARGMQKYAELMMSQK